MPQPAGCIASFGHTIPARRCAPPNGRPRCPSSVLTWGRETTGDLAAAERREWLCTNGIGGFASGTVAGTLTRRYHGLLVAALEPPLGRTLLVAKIEDRVEYGGSTHELSVNRWADGTNAPSGHLSLELFHLHGTTPVWISALHEALVALRVWIGQGAHTPS